MPLGIVGLVGPDSPTAAGSQLQLRMGPTGELIENQMYGKYYEANRLGLIFTASQTVAGVALLTATSTTVNFALFNPPASGKRAILIKTALGYVSGTGTPGAIVYAVQTSAVSTVTGTALTIVSNANPNVTASAMQAFSTATVVAATILRPARYSQWTGTAAATTAPPFQFDEDLDGSIVLNPGGLFVIGGNIALTTVAMCSVSWIELPYVAGA